MNTLEHQIEILKTALLIIANLPYDDKENEEATSLEGYPVYIELTHSECADYLGKAVKIANDALFYANRGQQTIVLHDEVLL